MDEMATISAHKSVKCLQLRWFQGSDPTETPTRGGICVAEVQGFTCMASGPVTVKALWPACCCSRMLMAEFRTGFELTQLSLNVTQETLKDIDALRTVV